MYGYTNTNPPLVLVEPEKVTQDKLSSIKYEGDFGEIVGIGTSTVVGIGTTYNDLFIPKILFFVIHRSCLRDCEWYCIRILLYSIRW